MVDSVRNSEYIPRGCVPIDLGNGSPSAAGRRFGAAVCFAAGMKRGREPIVNWTDLRIRGVSTMQRVALIGLGVMGSGMASQLLEHGFALTVYNRTPARCAGTERRTSCVFGSRRVRECGCGPLHGG